MSRDFPSKGIPHASFDRATANDGDPPGIKHDPANGRFTSGGGGASGNAGENIAKGLSKFTSESEASAKKFPKGTSVRANRQGAPALKVTGHSGNMLELSDGSTMHVSKAVSAG